MKQAAGQANMTVIVIVLLGIVAAAGGILIPRITNNTIYASCCNEAGGKWKNGYCTLSTPDACSRKNQIWNEFESCAVEHEKNNASQKYKATECAS